PTTFSAFGELVVLVLIQLGGLGIMTFSTAALFVFGRRVSLRYERSVSDLFVTWEDLDPARAVRNILMVTFGAEGAGALFLAARFSTHYGESLTLSVWRGVFTAVSAFCNAGFALQSDSLVAYQSDPFVLLIVGALIFVGALGPVVVLTSLSRQTHHVPVRLMVTVSAVLVGVGAVLVGALEWNASLAGLSTPDRLINALFQSVTLRTAGFNSVDFETLRAPTLSLMLLFMFIGGSPGSTAGGVKTTTFAVLVLSVLATLQGRPAVVYQRRRITHATFYRAAAIVFLGATSALGLWTALLITQEVAPLPALFETVSALGTVGLSVGVTGDLDAVGKVLVSIGMFLGRLGPISVLLLFASGRRPPRWDYAEQDVPVG
ncbi:MAG: potassium transporter TrkG, partial [Myxococcota bacterium]